MTLIRVKVGDLEIKCLVPKKQLAQGFFSTHRPMKKKK